MSYMKCEAIDQMNNPCKDVSDDYLFKLRDCAGMIHGILGSTGEFTVSELACYVAEEIERRFPIEKS